MGRRLDLMAWVFIAIAYLSATVIVFMCGRTYQKRSDAHNLYNIETMNLLLDQYDKALDIAGNHFENYVLDVYAEGDEYYGSYIEEQYNAYLSAMDSIQSIFEENR